MAPSRLRLGLSLIGLLLANLAVVYVLWWQYSSSATLSSLGFAVVGVPVAQVMLLGIWLSLGDAKWYWRLIVVALAIYSIGLVIAVSTSFSPRSRRAAAPDLPITFCLPLGILALTLYALLLPLWRVRGWRLGMGRAVSSGRKFHIADCLLWMLAIAVPLAAGRGLVSFAEGPMLEMILLVGAVAVILTPIVWSAVLICFNPKNRRRRLVFLACWTALYASVFVIVSEFLLYRQLLQINRGVAPPWYFFALDALRPLLFFSTGLAVPVVNCLALGAAGWRLNRPLNQANNRTLTRAG